MTTLLVTGGIGSGKSAVCSYLESRGIPVYNSDLRAKALYDEVPGFSQRIDAMFGGGMLDAEGRLDKKALAARIFSAPEDLKKLEAMVHPAVLEDFLRWRNGSDAKVVAMESAIAAGIPYFLPHFDHIILVEAPVEMRLERASKRDSSSKEAILARIQAQKHDHSVADAVIVNDSSLDELWERTEHALEKMSIFANRNEINTKTKMKTDLTRILSVSGQHGLYQYIAQARTGAIAECLADKKRTVFDMRSRITTLADIAIYTSEGELKLQEVFEKLHEVLGENDAPTSKASSDELKSLFAQAVPNYDEDRFYVSHMKKVVDWYNDLKNNASLDFLNPEDAQEEAAAEETENA